MQWTSILTAEQTLEGSCSATEGVHDGSQNAWPACFSAFLLKVLEVDVGISM